MKVNYIKNVRSKNGEVGYSPFIVHAGQGLKEDVRGKVLVGRVEIFD